MTDFYDEQARRHLISSAEQQRRELRSFDTTPIPGVEDYGSCGTMLANGVAHWDESIPSGQRKRTELAADLVVQGVLGTLNWLRAKGLRVPAIVVIDFDAAEWPPIDMVLYCPGCGTQHVDAPEDLHDIEGGCDIRGRSPWTNPPHRSHLCHGCGYIWRPADVATNGVNAIATRGQNDSLPMAVAHPYARLEANVASHDLYTDADKDRPDAICDANGQVVLSLCKRCGKGESELYQPCAAQAAQPKDAA